MKEILQNALAFGVLGVVLLLALQHPAIRHNVGQGYFDFIALYTAGEIIRDGRAAELYHREIQLEYQRRTTGRPFPLAYYHPPFEALVFVPLSCLSYWQAYQVWAFLNLGFAIAAGVLLRRFLGKILRLPFRLALVLACMLPYVVALMQGQDSLMFLVVYSAAFVSLKEEREFRAGGLLALGLFRPQLVLPFVLPFLLKKRWRFVGGFAAAALLLAVLSMGLVGIQGLADWVNLVRAESMQPAGPAGMTERTVHPQAMASLRGLLSSVLTGGVSEAWVNSLAIILSALLFTGVLFQWRGEYRPRDVRFDRTAAATVVATLLASFHLNPHDLSLLFLPLAVSLAAAQSAPHTNAFRDAPLMGAILTFILTFLYVLAAGQRSFFLLAIPLLLIFGSISLDLIRSRSEVRTERLTL